MATPQGDDAAKPDDFGASLMKTLQEDLHQLRVGNAAPETVPVFKDGSDPDRQYVRFADLSTNVRRILDMCPEVEIRIDGRRYEGERGFREIGGYRSPVLQWDHDKSRARTR